MLRSACFFIFVFILSILSASSQEDSETIKITSADVDKFITSFPDIQKDLEALDAHYIQSDDNLTMPEGVEIMNKINDIVREHGYTDYYDYIAEAGAIITAYTSVELGREAGSIQPEIQKALNEIEQNPYLTAEQKKDMKTALMQSSQAMEDYSKSASTDENVEVIKPYTDRIKQMLETMDD